MDSRSGAVTVDGQFSGAGPLGSGRTRLLSVLGRGGVPASGVAAVVMNVTATEPTAASYLTVFPSGTARPNTSSLNVVPGQTIPNLVIAKVGTDGKVAFYNNAGATQVLADVLGWFSTGTGYVPLSPARLMDTRSGAVTVDGLFSGAGKIGPTGTRTLSVLNRGGVPVSGVGAVVLNVTVTEPTAPSYLTVFPSGETRPNTSNLNYTAGVTIPNLVVAKVGADGKVAFYNNAGSTHVVVDVLGWFPGDPSFTPLSPARLMDTRAGAVTVDGQFAGGGVIGPGQSRTFTVLGRGGVPAMGVGAVALNVTATEPTAPSYLTVFPSGRPRPNTSNLNFTPGLTIPNMVVAQIGTSGSVTIYNNAGATHVVVDVLGWFPVGTNQPDPNTVNANPANVTIQTNDPNGPSTLTYTGPTPLKPGNILVTTDTDGNPFYGTVTQVVGTQVTADPATLQDIFPNLDLSVTGDPSTGGASTASVNAEGASPSVSAFDAPVTTESVTPTCSGSISPAVSLNITANVTSFVLDAHWKVAWSGIGIQRLEAAYTPSLSVTAHAGVTVSGSCSFTAPLFDVKLPTIKFSIYGVPVIITEGLKGVVNGSISATGAASLDAAYTEQGRFGTIYQNGSWTPEKTFTATKTLTPNVSIDAEADLSAPITYSAHAYGIVGFDATAGPFSKLHVDPLGQPWLTLDVGVHGNLSAVFSLPKPIGFTKSYSLADGDLYSTRLLSLSGTPNTFAITTSSLPSQVVGPAYAATLSASGGSPPYTWSASPLPPGLAVNGSTIVGTPTAPAKRSVHLTVQDSQGRLAQADLTLSITGAPLTVVHPSGPDRYSTAVYGVACGAPTVPGDYMYRFLTAGPDYGWGASGSNFAQPGTTPEMVSVPSWSGTAEPHDYLIDCRETTPDGDPSTALVLFEYPLVTLTVTGPQGTVNLSTSSIRVALQSPSPQTQASQPASGRDCHCSHRDLPRRNRICGRCCIEDRCHFRSGFVVGDIANTNRRIDGQLHGFSDLLC